MLTNSLGVAVCEEHISSRMEDTAATQQQERWCTKLPLPVSLSEPACNRGAFSSTIDDHARQLITVDRAVQSLLSTNPLESDGPNKVIFAYLSSRFPAFVRLTALRDQGWQSSKGDKHFRSLRSKADNADAKVSSVFFEQMVQNGRELQHATSGFKIISQAMPNSPPDSILEFGTAPGGFLHVALQVNTSARATAFTLPVELGGHPINIEPEVLSAKVDLTTADITLFAADMGVTVIPSSHADAENFILDRKIPAEALFDLVICGAGVLRTHDRAEYRERREPRRLAATQLALGLGHMRDGGTLIMLLHKPESWDVVKLLHALDKFADVRLFKPRRAHVIRSSFYLVAKNVRSESKLAQELVQKWKQEWKVSTFGSDEQFQKMLNKDDDTVEDVLKAFGEKLGRLGKAVWEVQANALKKSSWLKK